jgi:hypothetical protein
MAKIARGRLSGFDGMESHSAVELLARADALEAQIADASSGDDPRYLRRWANKLRRLAAEKEAALQHKEQALQRSVRRLTRRCS